MVLDPAANFVRGSADASIASADTTISVSDASIFPDPATEGNYNLVLWDAATHPRPDQDTNVEIVRVTGRDTNNDDLTVSRGQETTSAANHPSGSAVQLSPTAKMFGDIESTFGNFWDAGNSELTADVDNTNTDTANLGNNGSDVSVDDNLDLQSSNEIKNATAVSTDNARIATVSAINEADSVNERIKVAKRTNINGTEIWSFSGFSDSVFSSPTVVDGVVYVGSDDNTLRAVDASDGTEIWSFSKFSNNVRSSPTVVDGVVYVGSYDTTLRAVDASDGTEIWSFSGFSGSVYPSPTVVDGVVYVGSNDNTLRAVDASDGTEIWSFSKFSNNVSSSPTVVDGVVYVGSYDTTLRAVDASDGTEIWSFSGFSGSVYSSPTVVDGVVYVGSHDNTLRAVDAVERFARLYVADSEGWIPLYRGPNSQPQVAGSTLTGNYTTQTETNQ